MESDALIDFQEETNLKFIPNMPIKRVIITQNAEFGPQIPLKL